MSRFDPRLEFPRGLAIVALLLAVAACSREPVPIVALPPALEAPAVIDEERAGTTSTAPRQTSDTLPQNDGMSAAAGLPQPLAMPLVDDLQIDFEYGTLFEFSLDPHSTERQVRIEPIGTPVEAALDSLAASFKRAGFEPSPASEETGSLHRLFRKTAQPGDLEIELLASAYADPELAAHPGGTGSVALHLRPRKGND